MFRTTCFTLLLATAAACTDSPAAPIARWAPEPEDSGFETVTGTVVSETALRRNDDGTVVPLLGPQTALLTELIGAEIRVRATADEIGAEALWIVEFRVLLVDGLPAFDGMLVAGEEGYAIETMEGSYEPIPSIPDDLAFHVGSRVWLTTADGHCVRYGVLQE
jgi:hypothetical protein